MAARTRRRNHGRLVEMANPSHIALLGNPRRKRRAQPTMAATRRRRTNYRRRTARPRANPPRRRRRNTRRITVVNPIPRRRRVYRHRNAAPRRRRRYSNPPRRHYRRHRNPSGQMKNLVMGALWVGGGIVGTNKAMSFIPTFSIGGVYGTIVVKAIAAWLLGNILHRVGASQQNAYLFTLGGVGSAGADLVNVVVNKTMPTLFQTPAAPPQPLPAGAPVGQIDPYYGVPVAGMQDLVASRYRGMGAIVVYKRP
jgi:hypothetical protein